MTDVREVKKEEKIVSVGMPVVDELSDFALETARRYLHRMRYREKSFDLFRVRNFVPFTSHFNTRNFIGSSNLN